MEQGREGWAPWPEVAEVSAQCPIWDTIHMGMACAHPILHLIEGPSMALSLEQAMVAFHGVEAVEGALVVGEGFRRW